MAARAATAELLDDLNASTKSFRLQGLPDWPRGLGRVEAALYIGVSPSKFDEMVKDGRMPPPKRIDGRRVWDKKRLDLAFEALPDKESNNPWDETPGGGGNENSNARRFGGS